MDTVWEFLLGIGEIVAQTLIVDAKHHKPNTKEILWNMLAVSVGCVLIVGLLISSAALADYFGLFQVVNLCFWTSLTQFVILTMKRRN